MKQKIAVLGAGLVGPLLSLLLVKKGFDIEVFEKRESPLGNNTASGRSINLALSDRGIKSLQLAGVFDQVKKLLIPMKGRRLHSDKGEVFHPYGLRNQHINSVSRLSLNQLLIREAMDAGVLFHFSTEIESIDIQKTSLFLDGSPLPYDVILGADGANSTLRKHFADAHTPFESREELLDYGYKELSIPPFKNDFALEPHSLHIWPRKQFMLIALPNLDKSFTCTLFLPYQGALSFESINSPESLTHFFNSEFNEVVELIPDLIDQFHTNPTSSLQTTRSFPWHIHQSLLIGDAAHAIVPFYGQGMNAGFEDCRLLLEQAEIHQFDWKKTFEEFQLQRKPDADAIAELALQNFVEMRDKVLDPQFQKQKRLEARLQEEFQEAWEPLYSMVTFSDIPYHKAQKYGQLQQKVIDTLGKDYDPETVNTKKLIKQFKKLTKDDH